MKKLIGISTIIFAPSLLTGDIDTAALSTVESFEKLFGVTEGKRRNHTKGFCFEATLEPHDTDEIKKLSNSSLFSGVSNVIGRLSHKGGNNEAADDIHADYGMGLAITSPTGETHMMSMNTLDFFPVATPEAFADLMTAKVKGGNAILAFKESNSDLQRFKAHEAKKDKTLTHYEGSSYNSVNSFYMTNSSGKKTAARWSFIPQKPQAIVLEPKQDFFFKNMAQNLSRGDIAWNMLVTIANDDDVIENAALPWSGEHKQLIAAKLIVQSISSELEGKCDTINYDPLILSKGFDPSADPLLQARRTSYATSFGRRMSEK